MHPTASTPAGTCEHGRTFAVRVFRASIYLVGLLGLSACADMSANQAPSTSITFVQQQLSQAQLALRTLLMAKETALPAATQGRQDPVLAFYKARNFLPAWTASPEQKEEARKVRALLARAHEQGLRDEDYKAPQDRAEPISDAQAAAYDVALSDAVLRYAHDVRTGRVRANDIYKDVILPDSQFDAFSLLGKALTDHSSADFLANLAPPHPEYRQLAIALAQYRAIADKGGWQALPAQSEIKLEGNDPRVSQLAKRLTFEDPVLAAIPSPSKAELRDAVKRFQARNGLADDGRVGAGTLAALNVQAVFRVAQIAANMERWRWIPQFEQRYIAVNVPDQSLEFVRDGAVALHSRVIVGRKSSPTPITRSAIVAIIANPPWNIPGDIAARDLLPHLRTSSNYLATKHMIVTDGPPGDPYGRTINWRNIVPAEFPYAIQQLPGPTTALGALMLDSPNDFDVYLHDTPNKTRFEAIDREISNGCVRVQQILPLASLVLTGDTAKGMDSLSQAIKTRQTKRLELGSSLPVYFLYWTALPGADGTIGFRPDLYGRDAPLISALTKDPRSIPADDNHMGVVTDKDSDPSEADDPSP